jgi:tripartite-type tricarboxylate transporter receptor subunit TctC
MALRIRDAIPAAFAALAVALSSLAAAAYPEKPITIMPQNTAQ